MNPAEKLAAAAAVAVERPDLAARLRAEAIAELEPPPPSTGKVLVAFYMRDGTVELRVADDDGGATLDSKRP